MPQLHILNGDATFNVFAETGLNGDVVVWREVFSEGPLTGSLDAGFWQNRADFITSTFNAKFDDYQQKVIHPLEKLNKPYHDITLWFEFDLHCQANLLGVMQLLQQHIDLSSPQIYLVCPDNHPEVTNFRGMGQLNAEQLEVLYDSRLQLTNYDFDLAAQAWQKYTANNAAELQQWMSGVTFWGSLHNLEPALQAHIKRLQTNEHGLSYIEQKLLHLYNNGITNRPQIYEAFWNEAPIYGMGDKELDIYLDKLVERRLIVEI